MRNKIFTRFLLAFLFVCAGTFLYWLLRDTSDFVIIEKKPVYHTAWFGEVYKDIFADELFRKSYFPVFIFRRSDKNILHAYANEHFLNRLDTAYYSYCIIKR